MEAFNALLVNEKDPVQYFEEAGKSSKNYLTVKSQYKGQGRFPYD
jgi:hypothetical protein